MDTPTLAATFRLLRAHPWHGVPLGDGAPARVNCFIEIVPTDTVKYEIDKLSGYLKVDRPQRYSNVCPTLYGFLPQTYCGPEVGALSAAHAGRGSLDGDGDPLDVCVLTEKTIPRGDLLLEAVPIGGLQMIDGREADDKIVAVLVGDATYGGLSDLSECPRALIDRLRHYFLTYKDLPGVEARRVEIASVYGRERAEQVIEASRSDYRAHFGGHAEAYAALHRRG